MATDTTTQTVQQVILRDDFTETMRGHGYQTPAEIARAFDVAHSTVSRVLQGAAFPSAAFIARGLVVTGLRFEDLFTTQ